MLCRCWVAAAWLFVLTAPSHGAACEVASLEVTASAGVSTAPSAWRIASGSSAQLTVLAVAPDGSASEVTASAAYSPAGTHIAVGSEGALTFAHPSASTFEAVVVEYCGVQVAVFFEITPR